MIVRLLFIGTHRRAHRADPIDLAKGVYAWSDGPDGPLTALQIVATPQPGWIAAHPGGRFIYAVNEVRQTEGDDGSGVSAFAIAADGAVRPLNRQPTPAMPCHCSVDTTGRLLVVATFGGGSVHLFPLNEDGSIGPEADRHVHHGSSIHPRRQTEPHAHAAVIDPGNRFVLVPDLGTDQIVVYELDSDRLRLLPRPERHLSLPPGSGPRHLVFGSGGRFAYLMNEMSASVAVCSFDPQTGSMDLLQSVDLLPPGFTGLRSGAAIGLGADGRTLYATTRSHGSSGEPPERGLDSLAWCSVDRRTGLLTWIDRVQSGGEIPRSFTFDPSGRQLLVGHQASGTVVTFDLDPTTGAPTALDGIFETPVPVCLQFVAVPDSAITVPGKRD